MNKVIVSFLFFITSLIPQIAFAQASTTDSLLPTHPPFYAWISSRDDVWVFPSYGHLYPSLGLLRYGNVVHITACENNDCRSRSSWVMMEPYGIVRVGHLEPMSTRTREGSFLGGDPSNFTWAKALRAFNSTTGEHFRRGDEIVFTTDSSLLETSGMLERPDGGRVSASMVSIFAPSLFSGWVNPPDRFAFVLRDTTIAPSNRTLTRYTRLNVTASASPNVSITTTEGMVTRNDVRLGFKHSRPSSVPVGTRWVHVDLDQQVLTAYDYNDRLVFATLVSTGRGNNETRTGTFQVRRKTHHTHMAGGGSGRGHYSVDGVPWVMFFDEAIALHGAFWHDQFGTKRSHGCVNLSLADAQFLFNFAPMEIPSGWRAIHPIALEIPNLWVVIE